MVRPCVDTSELGQCGRRARENGGAQQARRGCSSKACGERHGSGVHFVYSRLNFMPAR